MYNQSYKEISGKSIDEDVDNWYALLYGVIHASTPVAK